MTGAFTIRGAALLDLQRILEIERLAFSQPWSRDAFKREFSLAFSRTIVAVWNSVDESAVVGFLCRWLVGSEYHVLNIAVHPAFRRFGIATALMDAAIGEARASESELITLEVRRSNVAARGLYRRYCFEERRLRRNYYGPGQDAIVMELQLKAPASL